MNTNGAEWALWLVVPFLVASGTAYLVWVVMQSRMRVLAADYRAAVAKVEMDSASRRPGVEELLAELRFERNRFLRRILGPNGYETSVITQERIYFRNVPLTGWIQDEVPLGEGEEIVSGNRMLPGSSAPTLQPAALSCDGLVRS